MCEIDNNYKNKALLYYKDLFSETYGRNLLLLWDVFYRYDATFHYHDSRRRD